MPHKRVSGYTHEDRAQSSHIPSTTYVVGAQPVHVPCRYRRSAPLKWSAAYTLLNTSLLLTTPKTPSPQAALYSVLAVALLNSANVTPGIRGQQARVHGTVGCTIENALLLQISHRYTQLHAGNGVHHRVLEPCRTNTYQDSHFHRKPSSSASPAVLTLPMAKKCA